MTTPSFEYGIPRWGEATGCSLLAQETKIPFHLKVWYWTRKRLKHDKQNKKKKKPHSYHCSRMFPFGEFLKNAHKVDAGKQISPAARFLIGIFLLKEKHKRFQSQTTLKGLLLKTSSKSSSQSLEWMKHLIGHLVITALFCPALRNVPTISSKKTPLMRPTATFWNPSLYKPV